MKFLIAEYAEKRENALKKLLRRMGIVRSFELYDTEILQTEGLIMTLPFLEEETENYDYCVEMTKKALGFARKECGDFVYTLPTEMKAMGGCSGVETSALVLWEQFVVLVKNKDLKTAKTAVMGYDVKTVRTVMEGIYDGLNSLVVLAPADKNLTERAKEIYEETGLDIIFIRNVKSPLFMDADIIINCGMDLGGGYNSVKKDAVYISLKGQDVVAQERKDVDFIDLDRIKVIDDELKSGELEAILSAGSYGYRNFLSSRYYEDKAKRAFLALKDVLRPEG